MKKIIRSRVLWMLQSALPFDVLCRLQHAFLHWKYGDSMYWLKLNNPRTFNEKILWLKRNFRNNLGPVVADKLAVRDYVKMQVGEEYLIPLHAEFKNAAEIKLESLPQKFILKPNHASGLVLICRDKNILDEKTMKTELNSWTKFDYSVAGREWQYKGIPPRILCEELLEPEKPLVDYKFFCFNGIPKFVQVDSDRGNNQTRAFFDMNWERQPFTILYPKTKAVIEEPQLFNEMKRLASVLSQDFIFTRVDLYECNGKVFFGEITLHPEGGNAPFLPQSFDLVLGNLLKLPTTSYSANR